MSDLHGGSSLGAGGDWDDDAGSSIGTSPDSTVFQQLALEFQLVADAAVAPADTPATDEVRGQRDAAGRRFIWTYSTGGWKGVEVT